MRNFYVDIHCHPTLKPYGRSFGLANGGNSINHNHKNSIWYYDPPNLFSKFLNILIGLTPFSQTNFSSLVHGKVGLIFVSLYPMEKYLFKNRLKKVIADLISKLLTGVSQERVNFVQNVTDYYDDLKGEYEFLRQLDGQIVCIAGRKYRYIIAGSSSEVESLLNQEDSDIFTIVVLITFEGGHSFGCGIDPQVNKCDEVKVLQRVQDVKNWPHRPLYITFAHHFYNELCGHARSFNGIAGKICDQSYMLGAGISELGHKVLRELLDNRKGKRIVVDVKHMSPQSRREYFHLLETEYETENIPIVVSHGAVCGNERNKHLFYNDEINFYDDELVAIAKSRGLFGVQFDGRRIASKSEIDANSRRISRKENLYNCARLVWRQIEHIAEVLDGHGLFAWDVQCIGSDYDGVVDPIKGYWTAEEFRYMEAHLLMHVYNYAADGMRSLKNEFNKTRPEEIVNRFMSLNAQEFIMRNY
ncbi:membrane dipeptidase [Solitalea koreensis]|uniref:Zn-dependent dipeptidase, dipeptidase homolog n=1 Tax=Solitalea koreensis TaxID=543615 RepID=A0A521E4X6_9SPHI|nr:membrane dipeptidase [Solitalea koreensis]SMO78989.1 Zn-dependent dipeptidase, dipeptidase homolog [Solitalea koreensis]